MRRPLTPATLRRRYHERRGEPLPPAESQLPPLGPEPDEDATAAWLAHLAAGRIEVR